MEWKEEDKYTEYLMDGDNVLGDITQVEMYGHTDERGIKRQLCFTVTKEDGSEVEDPIGFGVTYYKLHPKWKDFNPLKNQEEIDVGLFYTRNLAKKKLMEHVKSNIKITDN